MEIVKRVLAYVFIGLAILGSIFLLAKGFFAVAFTAFAIAIIAVAWFWSAERTAVAGFFQAIAAIVLVGVTWTYIEEVRKGNEAQQRSMSESIKELQEGRRQQALPYVYIVFYFRPDTQKFMVVLQNLGVGPAFDITYSYSVKDAADKEISWSGQLPALAAGEETVDMTIFGGEHTALENEVVVEVTYKDIFDRPYTKQYRHRLRELANNPPPTRHGEKISERLREETVIDRRLRDQQFLEALRGIETEILGVKEEIRKRP